VRRGVLHRKISYGTHSEEGSRFIERILSARATLRQQRRGDRESRDAVAEEWELRPRERELLTLLIAGAEREEVCARGRATERRRTRPTSPGRTTGDAQPVSR